MRVQKIQVNHNKYSVAPESHDLGIDLFENCMSPLYFAQKAADDFIERTSLAQRKESGQYFTPPEIANFMAKLATNIKGEIIRILDPGAGAGILSCALCEELAQRNGVKTIVIDAFESDAGLQRYLKMSFSHVSNWLKERGICLNYNLFEKDYIVAATEAASDKTFQPYDIIISNPPYFKISANDKRALMLNEVVFGQPNIYALFMATSVKLLKKSSGVLVFITPRSYTAGNYFKLFRKFFFEQVTPTRVHLFESRKDVFSKQSVLQESVILSARSGRPAKNILISTSKDLRNLDICKQNKVPTE